MSINATLFVQAIVFAILVWFTMKFVWPPITKALDERAQKIADGLAAADAAVADPKATAGTGEFRRVVLCARAGTNRLVVVAGDQPVAGGSEQLRAPGRGAAGGGGEWSGDRVEHDCRRGAAHRA